MTTPTDRAAAVVEQIASVPGLAARLLAEHVRGTDGRCARCPNGAQTGHQRWPCRIYSYASAAADVPRLSLVQAEDPD